MGILGEEGGKGGVCWGNCPADDAGDGGGGGRAEGSEEGGDGGGGREGEVEGADWHCRISESCRIVEF